MTSTVLNVPTLFGNMDSIEVAGGREFLARLEHGKDWRAQIEAFAEREGIDSAVFFGLGAAQDARIMFYDQAEKEYEPVEFDEPLEVASLVGNISWLDGERFAHTHATFSRPDGSTVAGHLDRATVFAGELYVRTFETKLERTHDDVTELDLWPLS
jgi:hypothetical protein